MRNRPKDLIKRYINKDNGWEMQIIQESGTGSSKEYNILVAIPIKELPFTVAPPSPCGLDEMLAKVSSHSSWMDKDENLTPLPEKEEKRGRTIIEEMERLGIDKEMIERVREFQQGKTSDSVVAEESFENINEGDIIDNG